MKYYLISEDTYKQLKQVADNCSNDLSYRAIWEAHDYNESELFLDDADDANRLIAMINTSPFITDDDYGLILDALYEQAMQHETESEDELGKSPSDVLYAKACRKVAKKFEMIFKEE